MIHLHGCGDDNSPATLHDRPYYYFFSARISRKLCHVYARAFNFTSRMLHKFNFFNTTSQLALTFSTLYTDDSKPLQITILLSLETTLHLPFSISILWWSSVHILDDYFYYTHVDWIIARCTRKIPMYI